jgi:hypothetical protein
MGRTAALTLALVAGLTVAGTAQESGTPVFKAPYRAFKNMELGVSLSDPKGGDLAFEGFYGFGNGENDIGLRGGIIDVGSTTRLALGASFRRRVIQASESFPLDGALTVGFGSQLGDGPDVFFVPVGLSLGRRVQLEGSKTSFVPFVQPVMVPTFWAGDNAPSSGLDLALGLGVDITFGGSFDLRVSGGIGDIDGVAVSVAWVR